MAQAQLQQFSVQLKGIEAGEGVQEEAAQLGALAVQMALIRDYDQPAAAENVADSAQEPCDASR